MLYSIIINIIRRIRNSIYDMVSSLNSENRKKGFGNQGIDMFY